MWLDHWHPCGPLMQKYGGRIIYDAGSSRYSTVADFIRTNEWAIPNPISRALIEVRNNLPTCRPCPGNDVEVEWTLTVDGKFSCKAVWEHLRSHSATVDWAVLVWYRDHIPRCSVITWLACKDRLRTKDRLYRWGVVTDPMCVLCGGQQE